MPVTLRLRASDPQHITRAAEILQAGGTVAFPTETVYGLGANALSADAVAGIFAAKERPSWDPLIVHVAEWSDVAKLAAMPSEVARRAEALARAFWPGPLTLLLPRRPLVPDAVTAGRPLVGIRVPAHPAAQALLRAGNLPLAAPSANLFGHTSPTTAQHVLDDLHGRIDAVLDGGATTIGVESTVLDPTATPMILYRPGALTPGELEEASKEKVVVFRPVTPTELPLGKSTGEHNQAGLPAPGITLRHYAPHARLVLSDGNAAALSQKVRQEASKGVKLGILLPEDWSAGDAPHFVERWAAWDAPDRLARKLFGGLRALDARGAQVICCPLPIEGGLNDAIRDRLQKAARSEE